VVELYIFRYSTVRKTQLTIIHLEDFLHYSPIYYPNPLADLLTISYGDYYYAIKLNYDVFRKMLVLVMIVRQFDNSLQ
jgi:hypothetical protein